MAPEETSNHLRSQANRRETTAERVSAGQSSVPDALLRLGAMIAEAPHNLVARGDRGAMWNRHLAECDALASTLTPTGTWMDLGTGGGLPGLVLAWHHRDVSWTLVDATAKKVAAVTEFASLLGLTNVRALQGRAEQLAQLPEHRAHYDGVVARALAPLAVLAELARGFLPDGGLLVSMKGPAVHSELAGARQALRTLRLHLVHTEQLPVPGRASWVVTMRAEGPPPVGYPRPDGTPRRQPLS